MTKCQSRGIARRSDEEPPSPQPSPPSVFGGVRPSSGAAMLKRDLAPEPLRTLEKAELAVAEDGHTPLNRYSPPGEGELLICPLERCDGAVDWMPRMQDQRATASSSPWGRGPG